MGNKQGNYSSELLKRDPNQQLKRNQKSRAQKPCIQVGVKLDESREMRASECERAQW